MVGDDRSPTSETNNTPIFMEIKVQNIFGP